MSGARVKLASALVALALVAAPACGGGGGASPATGPGGSPSPVAATFVADQPTPTAGEAVMTQGSKTNDVVTVLVTLTDTNGVFGAAFEVTYDPVHCGYLGFSKGSVFEQGGNTPNYTISVDPSNAGRIVAAIVRTNGTTTDVAGTRTMVGLQFRVKEGGTFPLTIENASLYDGQASPQPIPGIAWYAGALKGN